jgi:ABC-type branched-subunit amino acid transport system substrate-binding protein
MSTTARTRLAAALVAGMVATACGSTVQPRPDGSLAAPGDVSQAAPGSGDAANLGGSSGSRGPSGAAMGGPSVPGDAAPAGGPADTAGQAGGYATSTGAAAVANRGPIEIGVVRTLNADSALAKYGGAGLAFGDQKLATESYIDWINAHGGLAGRPVHAVFYNYDYNTNDAPAEYQKACTYLTEDHHVQVAFGLLSSILPVMVACMEKHHTPFIYASTQPLSAGTTSRRPGLIYTPTLPSLERTASLLADGLAGASFFSPSTKVGIFRMNIPDYADVTKKVLRPALARLGVKVVDEETFDQQNQQQDVGNAVLKFRASGVNAVLFLSNANAPFFFIPAATSQGYFPRYGFSSTNAPELQAENFPAQSLQDSMVVGLNRYEDITGGGRPIPSSQERCARIFMARGGDYPSGVSYITVHGWCDLFFFFRAIGGAAVRAGRLDIETMLQARNRLGSTIDVSSAYLTRFDAQRIDGVDGYRMLRYDSSCTCFNYSGPPKRYR